MEYIIEFWIPKIVGTNNNEEAANRWFNFGMGVWHPPNWAFINCLKNFNLTMIIFILSEQGKS